MFASKLAISPTPNEKGKSDKRELRHPIMFVLPSKNFDQDLLYKITELPDPLLPFITWTELEKVGNRDQFDDGTDMLKAINN